MQESVPENPSPVPSDATTVLYPNPDEGDTLLSHTLINDPGRTPLKMMAHIPICTPSCNDDDDVFLLHLAETEPAKGTSKRPMKNAFYLANHNNVHFDPVLGVYP